MGDSDNGVTLKIDADTAAYITQMVKIGQEHKKAGAHVEKWGGFLDEAKHKIMEMAIEAVSLGGAFETVKSVWESITEDIKEAAHHTDSMLEKTQRLASITGEGRAKIEADIRSVTGSPLSQEQSADAVTAFRSAAPGSSGVISTADAARAAGQARIAGYDPNAFMGEAGNLFGVTGAKSFDAATMLNRHLGGMAEGASEIIKKMSERLGPEMAAKMMPTLLASYESGDRKLGFVNEALSEWQPGQGDFGAFMGRSHARWSNRHRYDQIQGHMSKAQADVAGMGGSLDSAAGGALQDPEYAQHIGTVTDIAAAEGISTAAYGPTGTSLARRFAAIDKRNAANPNRKAVAWIEKGAVAAGEIGADAAGELVRELREGAAYKVPGFNDPKNPANMFLEQIRDAVHQSNTNKRLRPDAHGEGAR